MDRLLEAIRDYLWEHREEYKAWLKERERWGKENDQRDD